LRGDSRVGRTTRGGFVASLAITLFDNTLIPPNELNGVFSPNLDLTGYREMSINLFLYDQPRSQLQADANVEAYPYWYLLGRGESLASETLSFATTPTYFFHIPVHGPKAMIRVTNAGPTPHRIDGFVYAV
jgi:hypothetical protein